jgi:hypothetical protein
MSLELPDLFKTHTDRLINHMSPSSAGHITTKMNDGMTTGNDW